MDKVSKTINTLSKLFKENYIIISGLSGKDSICVAHCAVEALKKAREEEPNCLGELYISTTDTTIENIEVHNYILKLHKAADEYAAEYNLPIHTVSLKPKLFSRPLVEYIGRGKLLRTMVTASKGRDCAVDWKVNPCKDYIKSLKEKYQTEKILSISGTRESESVARAINIQKRQESIDIIAKTDMGLTLAPIKDWELNDVWGLIGKMENDEVESFANDHAGEMIKIYGAGNGGTCDIYFGNNKSNDKACGSRFGCYLCSFSQSDRSLENQIKISPERYGYMKPFVALRKFMNDTLFDNERSRSILGRDIKNGSWIKVGYNQYSLEYRKELLRYVLTIDAIENKEAQEKGIAPRFQLIDYDELIAIQYHWSREGGELKPAEAIAIFHEVHTYGKRYEIPETSSTPFEPKELDFGRLNFISGSGKVKYRYVDINTLEGLFSSEHTFNGFVADKSEQRVFQCHKVMLDGKMNHVIPFKEGKASAVNYELAEQYVLETYFDLEADGMFDRENQVCPSVILKDLLYNEVITLRKGMMNQLHQNMKRAQLFNAITANKHFGSSSIVDSVVLANSIVEAEYDAIITAKNDKEFKDAPQMCMGF